ncbi:MAG: Slp family lipoprotein, partial [Rhodanobacteraceae bacterium]
MRAPLASTFRLLLALSLPIAIAACAPAPIYKTGPSSATATPEQVATSPGSFRNMEVIWGGQVISVHNFAHHSEIEILAYPLDSSQRPRLKEPATGRFIAIAPG